MVCNNESVAAAKRIVVKVGTSTLTYGNGRTNIRRIDKIARTLCDLANQGKEIVLVSSGAIGVAVGKLNMSEKPEDMVTKQAASAVGQCELMMLYDKFFGEYSRTVAQILLTREDIETPRRAENTKNTMNRLLEMGIIPIVNENDTISVEEIEIGDNDTLSAVVSTLIDADLLILLSDIDGLYSDDPHKNPDAKLLDVVYDVDSVKNMASGSVTSRGTGGMITKLDAARFATENGINMIIANGSNVEGLYDILDGNICGTLFVSKGHINDGADAKRSK